MDNLCHSLVGAALAGAGLRRRTRLATATMIIGANLPDVDVGVYFVTGGTGALAFRRGWTHGVLAMVVLPFVLTAIMLAFGLWLDRRRRRRPRSFTGPPLLASQLLLVSAVAIWTHPFFDLLNVYGVRLLMPFSDHWFYGDTLFIVDPWIWLALGAGAAISIRRARAIPTGAASPVVMARAERPARRALAAVAVYIAVMAATSAIGRSIVERQATAAGLPRSTRVLVSPEAVNPFVRDVVRDLGDRYELGRLTWTLPPRYAPAPSSIPVHPAPEIERAALGMRGAQEFMSWARFPYAQVEQTGMVTIVTFDDARYARPGGASFARVRVVVPNAAGGR